MLFVIDLWQMLIFDQASCSIVCNQDPCLFAYSVMYGLVFNKFPPVVSFKHHYILFFIGIKVYREQSKEAKDVGRWTKEDQNRRGKRAPGFHHPDARPSE